MRKKILVLLYIMFSTITIIYIKQINLSQLDSNNIADTKIKTFVYDSDSIKTNQQNNQLTEADQIISKMTLDEKIGQLMIVGIPEGAQNDFLTEAIKYNKLGGFILFKRNYKNFKELFELNQTLKTLNKDNPLPLFISIDEEGGTVSRIPNDGVKMPSPRILGNINNLNLTETAGHIVGKQLYAASVNMNFAPVLDILTREDNNLMKKRSYGKNADTVSKHGIAFIQGLRKEGIIAVPKHFPGHGHTSIDSHANLPIIDIDRTTMEQREIIPFKNAISQGIDAIMIGHLAFPKIDSSGKPASKSAVFLNQVLRQELDFKGIAICDDIEMIGFLEDNNSIEEAVIESFNAGMDIFLVSHTKEIQNKVYNSLKEAVMNGLISQERLNMSLKRIIGVKLKYHLSNDMNLNYEEAYDLFTDKSYVDFIEDIKKR